MKSLETSSSVLSPFFSPRELQERWRCSRTSVDRIARRAGMARFCLGEGRNGIVRYSRKEVEAFEAKRRRESQSPAYGLLVRPFRKCKSAGTAAGS